MTKKDDEIIVPEQEEEFAIAKLRKVKKALKTCEQERKEYLDGWKRAKADALNEKKRQQKLLSTEQDTALARYVSAMLPILDSVRVALTAESGSLDEGVKQIHTQCLQSLESVGVEIIDPVGEPFDPHKHQAIGNREVADTKEVEKVIEVARVGALLNETVIRAAMVYVGVSNNTE